MLAGRHAIFPRGKGFQWRFQSATCGISESSVEHSTKALYGRVEG